MEPRDWLRRLAATARKTIAALRVRVLQPLAVRGTAAWSSVRADVLDPLRDQTTIAAVFRKEMVESFRDRRTVIVALLLPVVMMPIVTVGIPFLAQRQQQTLRKALPNVAIVRRASAPDLIEMGRKNQLFTPVELAQPRAALERGQVSAVLEIPLNFRRQLAAGAGEVTLFYDEGDTESRLARLRVLELVANYSVTVTEQRIRARGLSERDIAPIEVHATNIADERRLGGLLLAGILPFFISVWAVLGGQYSALDLGAGERERRTMEALLVTPPSRWILAAGKFLAVTAASMAAVVMVMLTTLVTMRLGAAWGITTLQKGMLLPAPGPAVLILLVSLSLVAFLSALQLTLSILARSVREAQQFFTPLYLILTLPALAAQFLESWQRANWTYLLPGLNAVFSLRQLLLGRPEWLHLVLTVGTTLVYGGVCLWLTVRLLAREQAGSTR
ncbi:MAG TPA: ABC transporter permease subunit [bacterium]|nr:ABC transporter permease subunit [bacterium]